MTTSVAPAPAPPDGFLAISTSAPAATVAELEVRLAGIGVGGAACACGRHLQMATWGSGAAPPDPNQALVLTRVLRRAGRRVTTETVGPWVASADPRLAELLPPFAAASLDGAGRLTVATDALGFRQLYVTSGFGWAAVSTSALVLGRYAGRSIDREAVALQSRLGWQMGRSTLFSRVTQLEAGHVASVGRGVLTTRPYVDLATTPSVTLDDAVVRAAELLRTTMAGIVEDSDGLVALQLTGGRTPVFSSVPSRPTIAGL